MIWLSGCALKSQLWGSWFKPCLGQNNLHFAKINLGHEGEETPKP